MVMAEAVVVSNWEHGRSAVETAIRILKNGGSTIDAVERGIMTVEDDLNVDSVGNGGMPNIEGVLELDASLMEGISFRAGAVTGLRLIRNPISAARKVMEICPHVMLSGEGALRFARAVGLEETNGLTPESILKWKKLKSEVLNYSNYDEMAAKFRRELGYDTNLKSLIDGIMMMTRAGQLKANSTVGVLSVDDSSIVAGTSTSGWALRLPGRVADSSVIGAGTYATPSGASSSTGQGEYSIKHNLTRKVCDLLELGLSPTEACEETLKNMLKKEKVDVIMALIAVDKRGNIGGATTKKGFCYYYRRLSEERTTRVVPSPV